MHNEALRQIIAHRGRKTERETRSQLQTTGDMATLS